MPPETIYVAPLSCVAGTIAEAQVSHLVTLINGDTLVATPATIPPDRHFRLAMNDICEPSPGLVLPCETHVTDLVNFALEWDRQAPLLIHCWAGISRSTAAAFITLCALNPEASEHALAQALRQASPTAYPNRRLVRLARRRRPWPLGAHDRRGGGDRPRRVCRRGASVRSARAGRGLTPWPSRAARSRAPRQPRSSLG